MQLRDYQRQAIADVVSAWGDGLSRVCLSLPTGSGKTTTAAGLALQACREGVRVGWLSDRLPLLDQARREFERAGLTCALLQGGNTDDGDKLSAADVVLCSSQTVSARGLTPDGLGLGVLIIDEAHYDRAASRRWLLLGEVPTLGLTATPLARWMTHDEGYGAPWQQLVAPMTTREAMERGWLIDPVFRAEVYDPDDLPEDIGDPTGAGGDWSDEQAARIMGRHTRAIVEAWLALVRLPLDRGGFQGPQGELACATIVQASTIEHAEALAQAFRDGTPDRHDWAPLHSRLAPQECDRLIDQHRGGRVNLVSVSKLSVGFDSPETCILVSARPSRKLITWAQLVGRIMRVPRMRTPRAVVLDCAGNAVAHAGALHRFWTQGPKWPLPERNVLGNAGSLSGDGAAGTCPDCPTVVQTPGSTHCAACFRPLTPPERRPERKVFRVSGVSPVDIGRSVLALARDRLQKGYAPDPQSAATWARRQVQVLTGRWPRMGWPVAGWEAPDGLTLERPHPVVTRTVRKNARAYREWVEADPATRPPAPEQHRVVLQLEAS